MTNHQWSCIKNEIEDAIAEEVSDAVVAAKSKAREETETAAQEGIVKVLRDLRSNHEDGSEGAKAMDEAIDAAERWSV